MPNDNQTLIPQSFMALFLTPGRTKPNASQEAVTSRYGLCEDMACMLTEHAQTIQFSLNLTEEDVLARCHQGLMTDAALFSEPESDWIVRRLAELLSWTAPQPITTA